MAESIKKVIFVQGPTGAGKSRWALEHAKRIPNSCIVNCDSVQIYKHVDIGSNKPSAEEMQAVPHYLYSHVEFPDSITAGQYERLFFSTLEKLNEKTVFVVGGTGFYFQAIEKGMYPVTSVQNEIKLETQQKIVEKGFGYLFDWVQREDPKYAMKLSRNDHYRIERAYQLMRSEGKSITCIQDEFEKTKRPFPYLLLKIGITEEKENLRPIVSARTDNMIAKGLIQEVEKLVAGGMVQWDPLNSVGYKEVVRYLSQPTNQAELASEIKMNTMKLVKKQKTWFQKDKEVVWLNAKQLNPEVFLSFLKS